MPSDTLTLRKITPTAFEQAMKQLREVHSQEGSPYPPLCDEVGSLLAESDEVHKLFNLVAGNFLRNALEQGAQQAFAIHYAFMVKHMTSVCETAIQSLDEPKTIDHLESMDLDLSLITIETAIADLVRANEGQTGPTSTRLERASRALVRVREILNNKGTL